MVEYTLTLNSDQAHETLKAVELLMRLKIRQFDALPYNVIGIERDDYCVKRDEAKPHLDALERIFFPNWQDIKKDAEWYRLYNLYQVLRYAIHEAEHPQTIGVDSYPPVQFSDEPLPMCEWTVDSIKADGRANV